MPERLDNHRTPVDLCKDLQKLIAHDPALENDAAIAVDAVELKYVLGEGHQPAIREAVRAQAENDGNDAEAICTAARQPHIPFVPKKTVEQQDIQALHRARQRMVNHRTAVVSQIRGLLLDRGFAIAKSITRARRLVPDILANFDNELTPMARDAIGELYDLFRDLTGGSLPSTRRSSKCSTTARPVSASPRSKASARRRLRRSSRPSAMAPSSKMGGIWPLGSVLSPDSSQAVTVRS
jgi:transposase